MALSPYTGNIPNRLTGADTFSADVDYYHAYFTPFITQFNADIAALNLASVADTSTTSNTIGTGSKSFTVSIGKSFQPGQYLIIADTAAPSTNSMVVQVTSYNSGTGALVVDCKVFVGSGTKTAWIISLTAAPIYGAFGRTFLDIKQLESIDYSFASGSLTLKLNPTNLDFRSTTTSSGTPTNVVAASQVTTTISSGSTAGTTSGVSSDIIILAINNAGTIELAWVNALAGFLFDETSLISTTAEGGAGAADSASVIYSTTARTSVAYRVVGLFRSTQTTAGTWAQTPTLVQGGSEFLRSYLSRRLILDAVTPAFSAYRSTNQTIASNTLTKVQCNTEEFDYTSCYDNSSNYRFQPNVAGLYQINFTITGGASTGMTRILATLYKNGADFKRGTDGTTNITTTVGNALVFMNGTTDYLELYAYITATTAVIDGAVGGVALTHFSASLVKAA